MGEHADKIEAWLRDVGAEAEFIRFDTSVHTVDEAVSASGIDIAHFTKSIAMITDSGQPVLAIVPADSRASTDRVRKALKLSERPRIATAEESEEKLGQKLGGNCPFNVASATVIVDPNVANREWAVLGGGDDKSLVKISIAELRRVVSFTEARVRR